MHDIQMQLDRSPGVAIDWSSVVKHSLVKAAIDSFAAMPGSALAASAHRAEHPAWSTRQPSRLLSERPSDILRSGLVESERSQPLDMPVLKSLPLSELGQRLKLTAIDVEPLRIRSNLPQEAVDFSCANRFLDSATEVVNTTVRIYSVSGHETRIVVPEYYAAELDVVRSLRLGMERGSSGRLSTPPDMSLLKRALPEDYIAHLDALPDPNLVKRIVISPEANPADLWHGRSAKVEGFVSAASANEQTGEITFFRRDADRDIGLEMNHEWSHLLRNEQPVLARLFDIGSQLEKTAPRERANVDAHENWSVGIGENLLNPLEYTFRQYAAHSPIKTWVAAEALQRSLSQSGQTGPAQFALQLRLATIAQEVAPAAVQKLNSIAYGGTPESAAAGILLVHMNKAAELRVDALNLSNEPLGDRHMSQLAQLNLRHLDISGTYVSELSFASNMPLSTLDISGTRITTSSLRPLRNSQVENLKLANTKVDDGAVGLLSNLNQLKLLDIRGTHITATGISALRRSMPTCVITH